MKKMLSVVAVVCVTVLAVSCGGGSSDNGGGGGGTVLASDKDRITAPDVSQADIDAAVAGNSAFAVDMYRKAEAVPGNVFFSPFSISLALAMTYAGAQNGTESQMANVLHFSLQQERLHSALNALDLALASRGQGASGTDGEPFRLRIANSTWGQTGYSFLGAYLDTLAENYGASLRLLDFAADPESCRVTINDWVSDRTEDRINDLIPQGAISAYTKLVLCNAIYFNAAWANQFEVAATRDDPFTLLDGAQVSVPMMHQSEAFARASGDGYQAIELPYDGNEISMVLIMPSAGRFAEFESSLTLERLNGIIAAFSYSQVDLSMPKFRVEVSVALKDSLQALGMTDAFEPGLADFSGMDGTRELYISDALHKAFILVDEHGTEAAAATAVIVGDTAAPAEPVEVKIDHPFIVLIRDIQTGSILFLGRVVDPKS